MHYILQASALVELWTSVDRDSDSWGQEEKNEFESNLRNALMNKQLTAVSRLGYEITPREGQPLQELYVLLTNFMDWMRRVSFQGVPDNEFELAAMLGLDVIIDKCQHPKLQTRALPQALNALINGDKLAFSVEQPLPPRTEEFELHARKIREIFETPEWAVQVNSAEYSDFLNFTPAFIFHMRHLEYRNSVKHELNLELLATPKELIRAFGRYSGIDEDWFKDLSSKSQSFQASRKQKGTHGRNAAKPLFCPYEFMKAIIERTKRKGGEVTDAILWKALKRHFSDVYELHKLNSPVETDD